MKQPCRWKLIDFSLDFFLLFFLLLKNRGQSLWLLVNKQPNECMFIVWEHLFLPHRHFCLSPWWLHRPLILTMKTKEWTSLWPCGNGLCLLSPFPLTVFFPIYLFIYFCNVICSPSPKHGGDGSDQSLKLSRALGENCQEGDMLKSCCEKPAERRKESNGSAFSVSYIRSCQSG